MTTNRSALSLSVALVAAVLSVVVPTATLRVAEAFRPPVVCVGSFLRHHHHQQQQQQRNHAGVLAASTTERDEKTTPEDPPEDASATTTTTLPEKKKVVVIGAGWGGLSAAHALASQSETPLEITVVDAAPTVGGLVRDGFRTLNGTMAAEAGQHGFWDNYHNIFSLLETAGIEGVDSDTVLTGYAEQGQYSPSGLEAVWPVYRRRSPRLPTGLAQALYTRFENLSPLDRASAAPLVLAFSEFDDSPRAWEKYDNISFRDLCQKLGVSKRCYDEAFEPMILTGLFAPGAECSAAAALGMAYFFVLKSQNSFDVRWCKGNIGEKIFRPWVAHMENNNEIKTNSDRQCVEFLTSTRVVGFETNGDDETISGVRCETKSGGGGDDTSTTTKTIESDAVVFAVGGAALNAVVRHSPELAKHADFRRFANLRGTGVLATRLYLDEFIDVPYSANACWGFDKGVGMTFFDITELHGLRENDENKNEAPAPPTGSVIEVDYYHAASLLVMDDESIVAKAKSDLDTMLGTSCASAGVSDAAVVKLPRAVNWYSPGSYASMPDTVSGAIPNAYFAGDLVRSRHGSWSQEKAYVSGIEAANAILGREPDHGIVPLDPDEFHVALGRKASSALRGFLGGGDPSKGPSLVDFFW